jgi:3-deoxy-7-phosphoheptulonate synthase
MSKIGNSLPAGAGAPGVTPKGVESAERSRFALHSVRLATAGPRRTYDLRIRDVRPLIPPAILAEEIPITERAADVIGDARSAIADIIHGRDSRLLVVAGPCSIHDTAAALEYGQRLKRIADRLADSLLIVMRVYFEKPRTAVGWKGFINDPDLDESFHINKGLRLARRLLLDLNELGLPTGSEFLDMQIPQHIGDLTSWVAIGARTTESQIHRELASGLSMPVGFKNSTDGNTQVAVDAIVAAGSPHWFTSVTVQGLSAIFQTSGNDACHVILRGGTRSGPNYDAEQVAKVTKQLAAKGLSETVMVDCSHGNSLKDYRKQVAVAESLSEQIASGSRHIVGVMFESHLVAGRQDYVPGQPATFGQSITDACLSLDETEPILEQLAAAQSRRG